jgi:hypothetical protein
MTTIRSAEGHNVPVTTLRPARTVLLAALLTPALLLSGCGGESKDKPTAKPSVNLPTGDVEVPAGVTLTKAGTKLKFGAPALVAYQPNPQRSSVLSLTVKSVQTGKISDLAAFQLDDATKASQPYYVNVAVQNVGTGDLSRMDVPLFAVDGSNSLLRPSSFNNGFARCPSTPLPSGFVAGKTFTSCLVYLIPNKGTLVEMSFRPLQTFEPITWQGPIQPVAKATKKPAKKPAKKTGKKVNP